MANYKIPIPYTKLKEGGLSSSQSDSAKAHPAPCGNGKNGFPYHTNKGIQYQTLSSNATKLGYVNSCDNFLKMPDAIWSKIFKSIYWDAIQGDKIINQAIANTFVEWAWGGGPSGATTSLKKFFNQTYNVNLKNNTEIVDFVNDLDKNKKSAELFEALFNYRKGILKSYNQPSNIKGWLARLDSFYLFNKPYAIAQSTKITAGVVGGLVIITFIAIKIWKRQQT